MSNEWLKGKIAIVTGSGQGIGRAIAVAMAAQGACVVTNNRTDGAAGGDARTTAREIIDDGGRAVPFFGDVSRFDVAEKLVRTAVESFGRLDILVNNATVYVSRPVWEMSEGEWDVCLDAGLKSAFNCTRHAAVLMKEQRSGRIINTTSNAWHGSLEMCNYAAAKAGIIGLTRAVAMDLGRFGVTCNAFSPAAATRWTVRPDTLARWEKRLEYGLISREGYEQRVAPLPPPETVPPLLVYLCSDLAAGINGQIFSIRGNRIAWYPRQADQNAISKEGGQWTVQELAQAVPSKLLAGYRNPAPVTHD